MTAHRFAVPLNFAHVHELTAAIEAYLAERNLAPRPYRWHKDGHVILERIRRAKEAAAQAGVV